MRTDAERLDWLEKYFGGGLISDDNGHWAVSGAGMQNVPSGDKPEYIAVTNFVEAEEWHSNIRDALDAAMDEDNAGG